MSSCIQFKEIGRLNAVSTRNVDFGNTKYKLLASYAGEHKKDVKKTAAESIEQAINNVIRKWPGGEFMTNVKLYQVSAFNPKKKYAVAGDVYGIVGKDGNVERSHRGFAVGDVVTWKRFGFKEGTIKTLQDDEKCIVERKKDGRLMRIKYTKLSK